MLVFIEIRHQKGRRLGSISAVVHAVLPAVFFVEIAAGRKEEIACSCAVDDAIAAIGQG